MNRTMIQFYHWYTAGDSFLWKHVVDEAGYLKSLGVDFVWLPPMGKGMAGAESVGYDAYDLYDLGEFDQKGSVPTKYGTREELMAACGALRAAGMEVVADVVLNHKGGADATERISVVKVDAADRNRVLSDVFEISAYTKFSFPGRGHVYSDYVWDYRSFSGVDYAVGAHTHAIYQIQHADGAGWDAVLDDELGNYDYLMFCDLDLGNARVRAELNHWAVWLYDQVRFGGVRLDAVKHIAPDFFMEWLHLLRANSGVNVFAVGEYWAPGNVDLLKRYLDATRGCMHLFDSALHHTFHKASRAGAAFDMRKILRGSLMLERPDAAVTLVANHDTQPLQSLEAPVDTWFKPLAYALILLRAEGLPCVFYPDLYGADYCDVGSDGGEHTIRMEKIACLERLMQLRKSHAYGRQVEYFDHPDCVGFTRLGDLKHRACAVVMSNRGAGVKRMELGSLYVGCAFVDALGHRAERIVVGADGWAEFTCAGGSVSVWVPA